MASFNKQEYIILIGIHILAALIMLARRDGLPMAVVLAACAIFMLWISFQFKNQLGFHILYWIEALIFYIVLLQDTIFIFSAYCYTNRVRDTFNVTLAEVKLFSFIIYFTLVYCLLVAGYYLTTE